MDISQIEAEARAQVEAEVRELVVEKLQAVKAERLSVLEQVKADLNQLDAEIAARVPQPEVPVEEVQPEEVPVG